MPLQETGFTLLSGIPSGERNGNLLHYSCLGNPMDREVWWATVHGVAKSWTWLNYVQANNKMANSQLLSGNEKGMELEERRCGSDNNS